MSQYIQTSTEVLLPEKLTPKAIWVVGRSLCLYRTFDLSDVPKKSRQGALQLLIRRWSPFNVVGSHVVWKDSIAGVWVWDAQRVDAEIEELGVEVISILPESVYYPTSDDLCVKWLSTAEGGVIFQLWREGFLLAEKWFSNEPSKESLQLFLRTLELKNLGLGWHDLSALVEDDIAVDSIPLSGKPWGGKSPLLVVLQKLPWEVIAVCVGVCLLSSAYVWQVTGVWVSSQAIHEVEQRIAEKELATGEILQAQTESVELNDLAKNLHQLLDRPAQRVMMVDVGRIVTPKALALVEWEYTEGMLEFVVEGDQIKPLEILRPLEDLSWVLEVTAAAGRSKSQHKFTLMLE